MNSQISFDEAQKFHELGKFQEAYVAYSNLISRGIEVSKCWNFIGLIYFQQQKLSDAISCWEKSISADNKLVDPYLNLAYVLNGQGEFQQALMYGQNAVKLDPHKEQTALQFASSLIGIHRYQEALDYLDTFQNSQVRNIELILAKIKAKRALGTYSEINELLRVAKQLNQPHPMLEVEKVLQLLDVDKIEDAYQIANEGLVNFPGFPQLLIVLGRVLSAQKETEKAISHFQAGLKSAAKDWEGWTCLGVSLVELGHFKDAIKAFEEAKALHPNHVGIQQRLAKAYARFVPPWHTEMLSDLERNRAFHDAIREVISKDDVVLEIGTGSGILSILSAKAGAKHVYGCEQLPEMVEVSLLNVERNKLQEKITVWNKSSSTLKAEDFEQKPSVLIAEVFDAGFIGEHAIPSFRHAINELCGDNCKVIPKRAELKARLIHIPSLGTLHPAREIEGISIAAFDRFRIPMEYESVHLHKYDYEFCSDEFDLLDIDFKNLFNPIPEYASESSSINVSITSSAEIHGVAFWFNLDLTDSIHLSNHPDRKNNHWGQAVFFFDEKKSFTVGENVSLEIFYNDYLIWFNELT